MGVKLLCICMHVLGLEPAIAVPFLSRLLNRLMVSIDWYRGFTAWWRDLGQTSGSSGGGSQVKQ
jgi:hypothetical protein